MLGQARRDYNRIGKRDLRWGLWLSAVCLGVGGLWWLVGSFRWQVLILLVLGVVFGMHTLVYSLPRTRRSGTPGLGASHPPLEAIQARLHRSQQEEAYKPKQIVAPPLVSKPYLDFGRCLEEAKGFLNQGDAKCALKVLETFAANDFRGIHTAYPEFYEILRVCQQSLGLKTRHADSQIEEMQLDWMTALNKGQQLLKAGNAKESIAYFKRSLKANPGEAGTASSEEAARLGIKSAEALLKRQRKP
jgi:tetratricopeptide (TPR) repeat protein